MTMHTYAGARCSVPLIQSCRRQRYTGVGDHESCFLSGYLSWRRRPCQWSGRYEQGERWNRIGGRSDHRSLSLV